MTVTTNDNTDGKKGATTGGRRRSVLVFVPHVTLEYAVKLLLEFNVYHAPVEGR